MRILATEGIAIHLAVFVTINRGEFLYLAGAKEYHAANKVQAIRMVCTGILFGGNRPAFIRCRITWLTSDI